MRVGELKANKKNPRRITDKKLEQLEKSMREYGDISGIWYNHTTEQIGGGTQRTSRFDKNSKIVITKKFSIPTRAGTVAHGYVVLDGERFSYREVKWSKTKETAANIAANKSAGEWDFVELTDAMKNLASFDSEEFDLDLTMFDEFERKQFEPVEEFVAEEHWTETFEPPVGQFKFVVTITDEKKKGAFLKRLGISNIKKKTGNVWSVSWPTDA